MTHRPVGDHPSRDFMEKSHEIRLSSEDNPAPAETLHRTRLHFINPGRAFLLTI
ncbi:MAG: hypothetical protein GY866_41620 [Proteobacteria bacterium]|nr:hypothetical protein [Pseudomonadota bacterium]